MSRRRGPPIAWAITRQGHHGARVVAITTERGRHWWGRTQADGVGTHGSSRDILCRLPTEDEALARLAAVRSLEDLRRTHQRTLTAAEAHLRRAADEALEAVSRGEQPPTLPIPIVQWA